MRKTPQFDKIFVVLTCAVLLACFVYCVVCADDISAYENRPANKVQPFSLAEYLDNTYQDGLEDALMDQMPLSETLKRFFHNTSTTLLARLMEPVMVQGMYLRVTSNVTPYFSASPSIRAVAFSWVFRSVSMAAASHWDSGSETRKKVSITFPSNFRLSPLFREPR